MNKKRLLKFTEGFLGMMFYSGILVLICLPWILKFVGTHYSSEIGEKYWPMLVTYAIAGICGITIVYQLRKMMKTVLERDCFVDKNIQSLRVMGKVSFVIAFVFLVKLLFLITPTTFVLILTFFIAGLFSSVLSCVFEEAVRYKRENDLTI